MFHLNPKNIWLKCNNNNCVFRRFTLQDVVKTTTFLSSLNPFFPQKMCCNSKILFGIFTLHAFVLNFFCSAIYRGFHSTVHVPSLHKYFSYVFIHKFRQIASQKELCQQLFVPIAKQNSLKCKLNTVKQNKKVKL